MKSTKDILIDAKQASAGLSLLSSEDKNRALLFMASALESAAGEILAANRQDMEVSRGRLSDVMLDRLALSPDRIASMADGIRAVALLPDPVGNVLEESTRPNGLLIRKISVPIGVVAIIYESRPNVTSDAAALCLKSGNVCILRGGKEAFASAMAITKALRCGLREAGLDENLLQPIEDVSRQSAVELMEATGYVDLLIPRGGAGLIKACVEQARVPVIQTGTGICHIYVDKTADPDMALSVIENAKTSRPSVCNAEEVLLVHEAIAPDFLPRLSERLGKNRLTAGNIPVELRCDPKALPFLPGGIPAGAKDFDTEFLDYILAVKVVSDVEEAIRHIAAHSTHHSEAIISQTDENIARFTASVDSAALYVNASTRFTDGGEFGLGCEMGISTQKLHARGPMGLRELNTYRYVITGNGQIR